MVALDNGAVFEVSRNQIGKVRLPHFTLTHAIILMALCLALAVFVARGFSDNGLRLATQTVWRFNFLIFFGALLAGPVGRLVPHLQRVAEASRDLLQGFCGGMAVYFALILLPNMVTVPDGISREGVTPGMTLFIILTGTVTLVMASAASRRLCAAVGDKACATMLGLAAIYFWLCYSLIGLAHISGPHRPDSFYELSVILMVVGLLARFADRFVATLHAPEVAARSPIKTQATPTK
jgi:hypothetical protein